MKRIVVICCLLAIVVCLCGCDPYAGKRPLDYPRSRWICNEPHIEIIVKELGVYTTTLGTGEEKREISMEFSYGAGIRAYWEDANVYSADNVLFTGDCTFLKTGFIVRIKKDNLWNGAYEELVFYRVPE